MTTSAVDAARSIFADVIGVAATLDEAEWQQPSACAGWTVKDTMAHLAGALDALVNPVPSNPLTATDDIEAANEIVVDRLTDRSSGEILDLYARSVPGALPRLAAFNDPAMASYPFSLGNAGTYPLSAATDALCFDHLVHLHADLLAPDGPINRPAPDLDELRLTPVIRWMVGGIPQMCGARLAPTLRRPLVIALDGPAGRRVALTADPDATGGVRVDDDAADAAATIRSTTVEFLRWATRRRPWSESVTLSGDTDYAATDLAEFRIF